MIKGGGSIHTQNLADPYVINGTNQGVGGSSLMGTQINIGNKGMKKNMNQSTFNQSKYVSGNISHHNQSQSPASQTFFKDSSKNKNNSSLMGKKGWPTIKKKTNNPGMYVSPYSKNPK